MYGSSTVLVSRINFVFYNEESTLSHMLLYSFQNNSHVQKFCGIRNKNSIFHSYLKIILLPIKITLLFQTASKYPFCFLRNFNKSYNGIYVWNSSAGTASKHFSACKVFSRTWFGFSIIQIMKMFIKIPSCHVLDLRVLVFSAAKLLRNLWCISV